MEINSYPKLYAIGHKYVSDLFYGNIVIEEKVDGSQFSFGVIDGKLQCRSKNKILDLDAPEAMFSGAVATAKRLFAEHRLPSGLFFRGEALNKPKHNVLSYSRTPNGNFLLFDVSLGGSENYYGPAEKEEIAKTLGLEVVPTYYSGIATCRPDNLSSFLHKESILGGPIEGFVVKNYGRFGVDKKIMIGKFVSQEFKETHQKTYKNAPDEKGIVQRLGDEYRSPARWQKAAQYLAEMGLLTNTNADIPKLMTRVQTDIKEECVQEIADKLFANAWPELSRSVVQDLPRWWLKKLKAITE